MKRTLLVPLMCLCLVSCDGNKYGEYPPFPVSGQILVNEKPAEHATVLFHLQGYNGEKTLLPQGMTDADGRFTLTTYAMNDGAPAGDYLVTVTWPPLGKGIRSGEDRLGGKFAKAESSGLTAHVDKGKNELKPFELQLELPEQPVKLPDAKKQFKNAKGPATTPPPASGK
jgi:hypothetical protein